MTTRTAAETLLFADVLPMGNKTQTRTMVPKRRRVCATYCPICTGWVEVRLQPIRLHCTGCGLEARP